MKRLVPLLFIVSLIISACTCQAQQQRYLGIVLGPNLANESTDSIPIGTPTSGRTGILAGIRLERRFSPQWGFSTEVDYVQEGRTDNLYGEGAGIFSGFTRTGAVTIKAAYIDAPLLVKKTIFSTNALHTYAFAGPAVGYYLSGQVHQNVLISKPGIVSFASDTTYDLNAYSFDLSILFGLGLSLKLDSGPTLFLDASYWYGLTNIFESYGGATYTRDIRITSGILFPINLPSLLH